MAPHRGRLMLLHVPSWVRYLLEAGGHLGAPLRGQCCIRGDCLIMLAVGNCVSSSRPSRPSPLPPLHFPLCSQASPVRVSQSKVKSRHFVTLVTVTVTSLVSHSSLPSSSVIKNTVKTFIVYAYDTIKKRMTRI